MNRLKKWLRLKLALTGLNAPVPGVTPPPAPLVEQQRATRGTKAAIPAAEWTDDIARQNAQIAKDYQAEIERRTLLFEKGQYKPRFGRFDEETGTFHPDIACDVQFEMSRANVTDIQPLQPLLTPEEFRDARTISGLTSEIETIELSQRTGEPVVPARPSRAEILAACGGDEVRAKQLEARVVELFGV